MPTPPILWGPQGRSNLLQTSIRWPGGDSAPLAMVDPRKGRIIRENYANRGSTATGTLGWVQAVNGTAATTDMNGLNGVSDGINQRFHQMDTGTTTTGEALLYLYGATTDGFAINTDIDFEIFWRIYIPDLSDETNEYDIRLGCGDNFSVSTFTEGIFFRYNRTSSVNWECVTVSSSTETNTDSGVAVVADTWVDTFWRHDSTNSEVKFYINDTLVATNSTNIPTGTAPNMHLIQDIKKSAGSTSRDMYTNGFQFAIYDPSA